MSHGHPFLWGATAMGCFVAGLYFLRFWRAGRDRFFLWFTGAFWLLALNWVALALVDYGAEAVHPAYVIRLAAFLVILAAILDKNRRA